jgi:hypothetical protein
LKINTCSKQAHNSTREAPRQRALKQDKAILTRWDTRTPRMYKLYARTLAHWRGGLICRSPLLTLHLLFTLYSASLSKPDCCFTQRGLSWCSWILGRSRHQQRACVLLCVLPPLHLLNLISELTLKFCTLCAQQSLCLLAITRLDSKPWLFCTAAGAPLIARTCGTWRVKSVKGKCTNILGSQIIRLVRFIFETM